MNRLVLKLYVRMQQFVESIKEDDGQDMVEYAVVMGLLALGATASMKTLATTIGAAFTSVGTKLTTYTS
jgi:pilus assembly protein Flp/PilA